jgi:predicted nucleic acid-binding protein
VILVDTNAWIAHLRKKDPRLVAFLSEHRVRTCDVVLGELQLGSGLPKTFSDDLRLLPKLPSPSCAETRGFIERFRKSFSGSGVGWADAQILLTAANAGAKLHSSDKYVRKVCRAIAVVLA